MMKKVLYGFWMVILITMMFASLGIFVGVLFDLDIMGVLEKIVKFVEHI